MRDNKNVGIYKIGQTAELTHSISAADIDAFAKLTGDYNPVHMNDEYATKMLLGKRVAHGMLTASFISNLIGEKLPGPGALLYEQNIHFVSPVYIGEIIRVVVQVVHIFYSQNVLILKTEIFNQQNKVVLTGEVKVKILEINDNFSYPSSVKSLSITPIKQSINRVKKKFKASAVIITGATGGIGSSVAKMLAQKKHPLILQFHKNYSKAEDLSREVKKLGGMCIPIQANLAEEKTIEHMIAECVKKFGAIAGIIHCAAPSIEEKALTEMCWYDFQRQLDIQVKGIFHLIQAAIPFMLKSEQTSIVNVISTVTHNAPPEKWSSYALAKTALLSLTRAFANELGPKNIRVNAVSPGMTATEMISHLSERSKMLFKMQSPLRRLAEPEDIAEVIEFLMSPAARHITGENINVCGGKIMR